MIQKALTKIVKNLILGKSVYIFIEIYIFYRIFDEKESFI